MVMLPDYPDRVIAEHRLRVEKASLVGTLILIGAGAWWLMESLGSDSEEMIRFAPVVLMFSAAILLPNLVEFGPEERFRVATACNVLWTPLLAFTEIQRHQGADLPPLILILAVTLALWWTSRQILGGSLRSRRWRGLTSLAGLGLATPILSATTNPLSWGIVVIPTLASMAPDLLTKDDLHEDRKKFSARLKGSETRILNFQSINSGMQQPASLLKSAREEGWNDPERGLTLIAEAEREVERIIAMSEDLLAIREGARKAVERAEIVTGAPGKPRHLYDLAVQESEHGSLREAEQLFRSAKSGANDIEAHWNAAKQAISEAEEAIGSESGHLVESVRKTLGAAKQAMNEEQPEDALAIVSTIPEQMEGVVSLLEAAVNSIDEAEHAISAAEGTISEDISNRLEEAKEAMEAGNASLAKGLADSISREQRSAADATSTVQRALRQRKQMEDRFPSGSSRSQWIERLDAIAALAGDGNWVGALESLDLLTSDLDTYDSKRKETQEMFDFLQSDWISLRKRLDSAGIGPDDGTRMSAEKALAEAEEKIEKGNLQNCLDLLGDADTAMESLRRRS